MYLKYIFTYTDETTTFHKFSQYSAHLVYGLQQIYDVWSAFFNTLRTILSALLELDLITKLTA